MSRRGSINWLLIMSVVGIVLATTYPGNFLIPQSLSWSTIVDRFIYTTTIKDYGRNILLFISWGIALAKLFNNQKANHSQIIFTVFLLSIFLSGSIELIQLLLPTRFSSLSDIICNTIGGVFGSILYVWRRDYTALVNAIVLRDYRQLNLKFLLAVIVSYCIIVGLAIAIFIGNINFNNWDEDDYLALGGEVTGQIHWTGYITSLHICDRALDAPEIDIALEHTHTFFSKLPSLIASLLLIEDRQSYMDYSHQLPDFVWQSNTRNAVTNISETKNIKSQTIDYLIHHKKTVLFKTGHNLISAFPVTQLSQRIKKSQEFSISIILASDLPKQPSPSRRIISLASDIYAPNLLLAQSGVDLTFRLRTPTTSTIANQPSFRIPDVFKDNKLHQILITFAHRNLTFYIDSQENKYSFRFQPSTHLKLYSPLMFNKWSVNLKHHSLLRSQIIFYSLILLPLAMLINILIKKTKANN